MVISQMLANIYYLLISEFKYTSPKNDIFRPNGREDTAFVWQFHQVLSSDRVWQGSHLAGRTTGPSCQQTGAPSPGLFRICHR